MNLTTEGEHGHRHGTTPRPNLRRVTDRRPRASPHFTASARVAGDRPARGAGRPDGRAEIERLFRAAAPIVQRVGVDRGTARRAPPEYRPRCWQPSRGAKRDDERQTAGFADLAGFARLLERPGGGGVQPRLWSPLHAPLPPCASLRVLLSSLARPDALKPRLPPSDRNEHADRERQEHENRDYPLSHCFGRGRDAATSPGRWGSEARAHSGDTIRAAGPARSRRRSG